MKKILACFLFCSVFLLAGGERELFSAAGGRVKTLDPVKADDLASRNMTGCIFDTLLQYDYMARPYKLVPSMLAKMPENRIK
jgi:ABC-type oligopeptide transport system substrate-binding subunit